MTLGVPERPANLEGRAVEVWDEIVAELVGSGIQLSKAHRTLLETAAVLVVDMEDCRERAQIEGSYRENPRTGAYQLHPAVRRLDALRRDFIKTMSQLGMRSASPGAMRNEPGDFLEEDDD
jgi:phage terminase small subunit